MHIGNMAAKQEAKDAKKEAKKAKGGKVHPSDAPPRLPSLAIPDEALQEMTKKLRSARRQFITVKKAEVGLQAARLKGSPGVRSIEGMPSGERREERGEGGAPGV